MFSTLANQTQPNRPNIKPTTQPTSKATKQTGKQVVKEKKTHRISEQLYRK